MRGKALPFLQDTFPPGITPAYAGKRDGLDELRVLEKDHPRLCGEKSTFTSHILILPGSPPPMRGKAPFRAGWGRRCGITPAYAGKRRAYHHQQNAEGDHPRLCGEKYMIDTKKSPWEGSPPPMRGKVSQADQDERGNGITPAYAGKSGEETPTDILQ